jgi:hypothetical protein
MKVQHNGRSNLFDTPGEVFTFLKELKRVWFIMVFLWDKMQFIVSSYLCDPGTELLMSSWNLDPFTTLSGRYSWFGHFQQFFSPWWVLLHL